MALLTEDMKQLILETLKGFNAWVKSDNVVYYKGMYRTQCGQYGKAYTKDELFAYYVSEYCE